jgi:hypothetical protein
VDWYAVYRRLLFGKARLRPWEVRQMTVPEVALALDEPAEDEGKRPPAGAVPLGPGGAAAAAREWRALSPSQRKARMREG